MISTIFQYDRVSHCVQSDRMTRITKSTRQDSRDVPSLQFFMIEFFCKLVQNYICSCNVQILTVLIRLISKSRMSVIDTHYIIYLQMVTALWKGKKKVIRDHMDERIADSYLLVFNKIERWYRARGNDIVSGYFMNNHYVILNLDTSYPQQKNRYNVISSQRCKKHMSTVFYRLKDALILECDLVNVCIYVVRSKYHDFSKTIRYILKQHLIGYEKIFFRWVRVRMKTILTSLIIYS